MLKWLISILFFFCIRFQNVSVNLSKLASNSTTIAYATDMYLIGIYDHFALATTDFFASGRLIVHMLIEKNES